MAVAMETSPADSHIYIAPIRGLFLPPERRQDRIEVDLGSGLAWRTPTPEDRRRLTLWAEFFSLGGSKLEARQLAAAATVLTRDSVEVERDESDEQFGWDRLAFLVTLTLHLSASVGTRTILFEKHEKDDVEVVGNTDSDRTLRLPNWTRAVPMPQDLPERVPASFAAVRRAIRAEDGHRFKRSVGAYRAAIFADFLEPTAILLCATLEALGTTSGSKILERLSERLIPRWSRASPLDRPDEEVLARLYRLRSVYVHGDALRWPALEDRLTILEDGLNLTKRILASALTDDQYFEVAGAGKKALERYLQGTSDP